MVDKKKLRAQFAKDWKKYYNMDTLKQEQFHRKKCSKCGINFWTRDTSRIICGDSACIGKYEFIGNPPTKKALEYTDVWKRFAKTLGKLGYTEIPRYPVIARWRDDTWFTEASIYCFQPYVISGEVKPPANPLVIPQPSLRFNDIENVGITGSHYTCHTHMGQHAFVSPTKFRPDTYLKHIYIWLTEGLNIPKDEIIFHEDVWAGGGSFGPCMEYFVRGLELGNQVYQQFKETPTGSQRLPLSVLDMGAGLERKAWITQKTPTSYDVVFGPLVKKYSKKFGLKYDEKLFAKFAEYAGTLNINEITDVNKAWEAISKKINIKPEELKETLEPLSAFYSILDHTRALLFAIADGALPSNSGGGYNLRVILRRTLKFKEKFAWNFDIVEMMRDHANILKPMYPELIASIPDIERVIRIEEEKYKESRKQSLQALNNTLNKQKSVTNNDLIKLYDSQGILPEDVKTLAEERNIKINIPDNFYSQVASTHMHEIKKKNLNVKDLKLPPTKLLFYDDEYTKEFIAIVQKVMDRFVVLDKTLFYPTQGGQLCDLGYIQGIKVVNVEKWGPVIVHELEKKPNFKAKQKVIGKIDWERRYAMMKHHTATHVINGLARQMLGNHIWQAGSYVAPDKARLDITHYETLTFEQLQELERRANQIETDSLKVAKAFVDKDKAEKMYGFRLYQGGAIPGSSLRILNIEGLDVEACGGTHVNNTSEIGFIKILGIKKIQDGVVRLEYCAGKPAIEKIQQLERISRDACSIFGVTPEQMPKTCDRFFTEWKAQKKELKKIKIDK
ncbi:MAG: alanine--tRNA ligase [Actinomycetota bacterium]